MAGRLLQRLVSSCSPQSVVRVRGTDLRISTKIQPPTPAYLEGTAGLGRIEDGMMECADLEAAWVAHRLGRVVGCNTVTREAARGRSRAQMRSRQGFSLYLQEGVTSKKQDYIVT